jgi:hypothetical protein
MKLPTAQFAIYLFYFCLSSCFPFMHNLLPIQCHICLICPSTLELKVEDHPLSANCAISSSVHPTYPPYIETFSPNLNHGIVMPWKQRVHLTVGCKQIIHMHKPSAKGIRARDSDFEGCSFYICDKWNQLQVGLVRSEAAMFWKVVTFPFHPQQRVSGFFAIADACLLSAKFNANFQYPWLVYVLYIIIFSTVIPIISQTKYKTGCRKIIIFFRFLLRWNCNFKWKYRRSTVIRSVSPWDWNQLSYCKAYSSRLTHEFMCVTFLCNLKLYCSLGCIQSAFFHTISLGFILISYSNSGFVLSSGVFHSGFRIKNYFTLVYFLDTSNYVLFSQVTIHSPFSLWLPSYLPKLIP